MCCRYRVSTQEFSMLERRVRNRCLCKGDTLPGASAPVLLWEEDAMRASSMRWGARTIGGMLISAPGETVREKPMLRQSAAKRRLLLPACGFYEWEHLPGGRRGARFFCRPAQEDPVYMAGLWLRTLDGPRFILLTRAADGQIAPLHTRMPLFLAPERHETWLRGENIWEEALDAQPPALVLLPDEPVPLPFF